MRFFKNIIALTIGHLTIFKHAFKKPVTLLYPEVKKVNNENFRGMHALVIDEKSNLKCIGCGTCQRVCPSFGTINIKSEKSESGKNVVKEFNIDLSKCIFCGNCVQSCPVAAIVMTGNYELADEKKSSLNLDINTLKNNYIKHIINK